MLAQCASQDTSTQICKNNVLQSFYRFINQYKYFSTITIHLHYIHRNLRVPKFENICNMQSLKHTVYALVVHCKTSIHELGASFSNRLHMQEPGDTYYSQQNLMVHSNVEKAEVQSWETRQFSHT